MLSFPSLSPIVQTFMGLMVVRQDRDTAQARLIEHTNQIYDVTSKMCRQHTCLISRFLLSAASHPSAIEG